MAGTGKGWGMKKVCSLWLFLVVVFAGIGAYAGSDGKGRIMGTMMLHNGEPMANGSAFLFKDGSGPPPVPEKYWRVPDEIVAIDASGRFSAEVPDGTYYLGAIKRISGNELGAPNDGDYFLINRDEKGNPKPYLVKAGETTDVGTISSVHPFSRATYLKQEGITAIAGTVTDDKGKPVERALVFAFVTPTMVGKPLFVSERTGKNGEFFLRVDKGGTYYLKSREVYGGGAPKAGEIIGGYGERTPEPVTVETGKTVKGVDLRVIRFKGRGPLKQ